MAKSLVDSSLPLLYEFVHIILEETIKRFTNMVGKEFDMVGPI